MISRPRFTGVVGGSVGTCAGCGTLVAGSLYVHNGTGEPYFFCGDCGHSIRTVDSRLNLKEAVNRYGGKWPPDNF